MLAYRLIFEIPLLSSRSRCPHCHMIIAWYDNIPLLSWLLLRGYCRHCNHTISWLYPFIEWLTAMTTLALYWYGEPSYWMGMFIVFSALIITIRTDLETMLISQWTTLAMIPCCFALSWFGHLPLSLADALIGSITAYLFLWLFSVGYTTLTKREGLGYGDIELLAFIGSFTGLGWWNILLFSSFLGSFIGIGYILCSAKSRYTKIPFGPFLALSAMAYVLFYTYLC